MLRGKITASGAALTPDATAPQTSAWNFGTGSAGSVALVTNSTLLTACSSSAVADVFGWFSTAGICYEGFNVPGAGSATSTAWYAGIMFVSLVTMGVLTYRTFAPEPAAAHPGENSEENDASEARGLVKLASTIATSPATLAGLVTKIPESCAPSSNTR